MQAIVVEPLGSAWAVKVEGCEPQFYSSGAKAEEASKTLATRLAAAGQNVEIDFMLRDGRKAARFVCLPPIDVDDRPLIVGGPALNFVQEELIPYD